MNLTRAGEKPLESHGATNPTPGSVSDWQSDRLAQSLSKMEAIFETAFEEQRKHLPGTAEGIIQAKAAIADIALAAKNDPSARRGLLEASEEFVKDMESLNLPKLIKEGKETETLGAAMAYLANSEFSKSTFYGVSQDACKAEVKLEQMCDRAHALVKAGYIGEKELEGVQVALADTQSIKARAAEAFANIALSNGMRNAPTGREPSSSYFEDDLAKIVGGESKNKPTIYVSADEAASMGGTRVEATGRVFSHELGHWLTRDKGGEQIGAGIEALKAKGGPDAVHLDQFFKPGDLTKPKLDMAARSNGGLLTQEIRLLEPAPGAVAVSWFKAAKEMQGDIMAVAAENAIGGKGAALAKAEQIASFRDNERLGDLAASANVLAAGVDPAKVRFSEEHYTSAAVRDFAAKIRDGELDKVKTPGQLDKLMGESLVKGLVTQYTQVRGAELNVHHVENGKIVPGVPPGVDLNSVLAAEMSKNLRHPTGQPTVLLTMQQAVDLPESALKATRDSAGNVTPAQTVGLTVQAPGQDAASAQKLYLSSVAPEGLTMPTVGRGTQEVGGHKIPEVMVPFAKDVVERGRAGHEAGLDKGNAASLNGAIDKPIGGELGAKEPGQAPAKEQKASPQPAAEMSR